MQRLEAHTASKMHSMKSSDNSVKETEAKLPVGNQKMLAEQHKNKRLAIARSVVGAGLIVCQF